VLEIFAEGNQEEQIRKMMALLPRENVTIVESTIRHEHMLVRANVRVKRGRVVDLIEVKAKSWDLGDDSLTGHTARANSITLAWE
jgi:hypothetical protein